MNESLLLADHLEQLVLLGCIYEYMYSRKYTVIFSKTMTVELEYINHLQKIFHIMLALYLIFLVTYVSSRVNSVERRVSNAVQSCNR